MQQSIERNRHKKQRAFLVDKNSLYEYVVALLFVLTTGTMVWFHVLGAAKSFILLLFVSLYVFYKRRQQIPYSYSLVYCVFCTIYSLLNIYFINRSAIVENVCIGYIVASFSCLIIIGTRNLFDFRDRLTVILAFINGWGLIVYYLYTIGVMDSFCVIKDYPTKTYTICMGISIGWPYPFERYAGIWHEPGAGQISSMFLLILHFREIILWKWKGNKQKISVLILLLSILASKSTTSYLLLMCFVLFIALYVGENKKKGYFKLVLKIILVVLGFVVAAFVFNSDVIQDKLFSSESVSKETRTLENITLLGIFIDNPIFGAGLGTSNQWYDLNRFDAAGCSNGLLFFASGLGLVWVIAFFMCLLKSVWKMGRIAPIPMVLIIYLVEICSQRYMEMPITFLFLFSFGSYRIPMYLRDKTMGNMERYIKISKLKFKT